MSPSHEQQLARRMIDAIREVLGKAPLYMHDTHLTDVERFVIVPVDTRSGRRATARPS